MACFSGEKTDKIREREEILGRVKVVCSMVCEAIANGESPEFCYRSRANWECICFKEHTGILLSEEDIKMVRVRQDNSQTSKSFGFMMKVLGIINKLVQEDKYCTKRDIFYQCPEEFGSQSVADKVVDNLACMLQVPRWKLHILASCKGLVAGDLQFYDEQGHHIDCNGTKLGVPIPAHEKDMLNLYTTANAVIVVEKDATFQKLLTDDFLVLNEKIILITGKGFPDIGTRLLLRHIWNNFKLPVFALVDADPHGLEIMFVYKYGSKNQAFENEHLAVPAMKWLGVLPTDVNNLSLNESAKLPLSEADLQKLMDILKRPYILPESPLAHQLQTMIQCGIKAEIQCLDSLDSSYLAKVYLPSKIQAGDWI